MVDVELDTSEIRKLERSFGRAETVAHTAMERAVERISDVWLRDARSRVPRGPSGAARASLQIVEGSGTAQLVGGGRKAPYFGWLDFGGRTGIRKSVKRPFIRGGRFIYPALVNQDRMITNILEDAAGDTVKAVNG